VREKRERGAARRLWGAVNSDVELQIRRINNSPAHAASLFCSCFTARELLLLIQAPDLCPGISLFVRSPLQITILCAKKTPAGEDANKFWARAPLTSGRF